MKVYVIVRKRPLLVIRRSKGLGDKPKETPRRSSRKSQIRQNLRSGKGSLPACPHEQSRARAKRRAGNLLVNIEAL
jgi:hypothetical protein